MVVSELLRIFGSPNFDGEFYVHYITEEKSSYNIKAKGAVSLTFLRNVSLPAIFQIGHIKTYD